MTEQDNDQSTRAMPGLGSTTPAKESKVGTPTSRPADLPSGSALLTVVDADLDTDYFLLTGEDALIGRSPDSAVMLDDVTVSRQHAKISMKNGKWTIKDLRSLNGTYLNRERVDDSLLNDGDELQVGKFRFVFVLAEVAK